MADRSVSIALSREADAHCLAPHLRGADRRELAALGADPLDSLVRGVRQSMPAYTARVNGEPAAMFGVCPLTRLSNHARIWLLGSDWVTRCPMVTLRHTRRFVAAAQSRWPILSNWVHAENAIAVRWLQWAGFSLGPAQAFGINGELFHYFEMRS